MTTVVTGANGHLGCNVVRALTDAGEDVRAVVHRNASNLESLPVEQAKGSILDPASLEAAFAGADHVLHLAAKISIVGDKDGSVRRINVDGAANVAAAARKAGARMVHVSSVHAFDLSGVHGTLDETHAKSGAGNYAYDRSKAAGEEAVRAEIAEGLDAVILNPTAIIGPADPAPSRMGQVFLDLRDRRMPALVQGAFDWVDVRDVSAAIIAARSRGNIGENHLVGGHHASVADLAKICSHVTGVAAPRMTMPLWIAALGVPFARAFSKGEPAFTFESLGALRHGVPVDHSKATRQLGHDPRPLQQTVADTYAWFEQVGM